MAVVNETGARRFWPGEDPIGKRVWFGSGTGFMDPSNPVEIVGVVGDVKYGTPDEAIGPDFYTSYLQFTYPSTMVLVKTSERLAAILPALRRAVADVDSGLPIYDVQTLDDRIVRTLARHARPACQRDRPDGRAPQRMTMPLVSGQCGCQRVDGCFR